jgi:hypothetical protein
MNEKDLDLNLDGFKVGAQLAVVKIKGGILEYCGLRKIYLWDKLMGFWRTEGNMKIPVDGKGYYAMSPNKNKPHFYYSANPEHILAAKDSATKAKAIRIKKDAVELARFNEFEGKLNALLKEYGAEIGAEQLSGDDQGVEVGWYISLGKNNKEMI